MSKTILVISVIIIVIGFGFWFYQPSVAPEKLTETEQACINSGGQVSTSSCCKTVSDFPNLCLIGPCGCSPNNSHRVKICDCGTNKCFDGNTCKVSTFFEDFEQKLDDIDFSEIDKASDWQAYISEEYSFKFKYPDNLFWQEPKIIPIDCDHNRFSIECPYIPIKGLTLSREEAIEKGLLQIEKTVMKSVPYCFQKSKEGAAGSTYITYYYTTLKDEKCFAVNFVVKNNNCGVFGSPDSEAYKECEYENNVIKLKMVGFVFSTFSFIEDIK